MKSLKIIFSHFNFFSPIWVFTSLNILIGTWVLYIPSVKEKLNLNDSEIGIALFCYALGILSALPIVPILSAKLGLGKITKYGISLLAISFLLPLLASHFLDLCISLFVVGLFSGTTDVAVNALVSKIEQDEKKSIMSVAHGFFSLGGVIGGALGSVIIVFNITPKIHMLAIAIFIIISNLILSKHYKNTIEVKLNTKKTKPSIKKLVPLLGLGFIAFAMMSSEGAIEHWSNLYFLEIVKITSKNTAAYGFIAFSIAMTLGRFFGDGISDKFGSYKIIIAGCVLAIIAYLFILKATLSISIFGFALLGIGLSVMIPELLRLAGKTKGIIPSKSISFVAGIGFMGFLIGPVAIGFISNHSSLKTSFIFLALVIFLALCVVVYKKKQA
ncbi:MFS family permease [Wenyingzhuangia heitensis]|uniref:MFS family permease n=1 Tax=Wenyingzhuangia heitensis TaxID=1487859 RepID=A0ABX0UBZ4_9FLAO|nr:MFS transporter [Wenyingzhuangia heitensis]NIJ46253.1 MFS family permease [Wenyingzhuangia heitensis]